ncbi:hypothetical protein C8J57DRAFT_1235909 [Mycena rebaudengoi]|nr:hypothetical protein C8J57DRAFT_1235909 [Mycena rebaudengoi]
MTQTGNKATQGIRAVGSSGVLDLKAARKDGRGAEEAAWEGAGGWKEEVSIGEIKTRKQSRRAVWHHKGGKSEDAFHHAIARKAQNANKRNKKTHKGATTSTRQQEKKRNGESEGWQEQRRKEGARCGARGSGLRQIMIAKKAGTTHAERNDEHVAKNSAKGIERREHGLGGGEESAGCGVQSASTPSAESMYAWSVRRVRVRKAGVAKELCRRSKGEGALETNLSRKPCAPVARAARRPSSPRNHPEPPQNTDRGVIVEGIAVCAWGSGAACQRALGERDIQRLSARDRRSGAHDERGRDRADGGRRVGRRRGRHATEERVWLPPVAVVTVPRHPWHGYPSRAVEDFSLRKTARKTRPSRPWNGFSVPTLTVPLVSAFEASRVLNMPLNEISEQLKYRNLPRIDVGV